jgi:site-specific DNA recombinase
MIRRVNGSAFSAKRMTVVLRRCGGNWEVAGIYIDDDWSAFSTRKPRPEYQRLLRDIQEGGVDGVLIWRLDRLHRQPRELEESIVITDNTRLRLRG